MNHTVLSRATEVTLKARLRGQFAALRFTLPPPDATDDDALPPDALELTCTLPHRGFRAVAMVCRCERLPAETADIVITPRLASETTMAAPCSPRSRLA